jgi:hypothetical protein
MVPEHAFTPLAAKRDNGHVKRWGRYTSLVPETSGPVAQLSGSGARKRANPPQFTANALLGAYKK